MAGTPEYFRQIRDYRYGYETPFIPQTFRFSEMVAKRVLEIGVGNGIDAVEMMRNGASYIGLDITRNHLDLTRRNVENEALESHLEDLIEGDLLETSLPGGYDVIYSFGVLHHIEHERQYLERLRGLLAPGGELRIAVYSKWSFFNIYMVAMWLAKGRKQPLDDYRSQVAEHPEPGNPVTIRIRARREVQRGLEAAGFQVIRYEKRGFVQNYIPVVGKRLAPDGSVLRTFGSVLGWYHCFTCS